MPWIRIYTVFVGTLISASTASLFKENQKLEPAEADALHFERELCNKNRIWGQKEAKGQKLT